jgi:hypothetical protein
MRKPENLGAFILFKFLPFLFPMLAFFILNLLTPVWWDDFVLSCFFNGWFQPKERLLASLIDVIDSTKEMYFTWHGRSVVDFLTFLFLFFKNKNIFNVFNTIVYGLLILLLCFHATGSLKKVNPFIFLFTNILVWIFTPSWGQDFLWITGSFNYLWTTTIILFFLIPYRKRIDNQEFSLNIVLSILFFFLGILAGWSIENSAAGIFIMLLGYFVIKAIRKEQISLFEILGIAGFLIGFILLISARKNIMTDFMEIITRFMDITMKLIVNCGLLVGLSIILVIEIVYFRKKKISASIYLFFLAGLTSVYSMIFSAGFPERAFLIPSICFLITLLGLVNTIRMGISKRYFMFISIIISIIFVPSFFYGTRSIVKSYLLSEAREVYIYEQKKNGNLNIQVKTPIPVVNTHSGLYGGIDILTEKEDPEYTVHNIAKTVYYGINSLDGIEVKEDGLTVIDVLKDYIKRKGKENLNTNDLFRMIYQNW